MHLERVQRKFLRFASYKLNISCEPHDYNPVSKVLGLSSLTNRMRFAEIKLLNVLLDNKVYSYALVSLISFKVPMRHTRTNPFFFYSIYFHQLYA